MYDLKRHIINDLYRDELSPEDIGDDTPLFSDGGIGLDSLDAVELEPIILENI